MANEFIVRKGLIVEGASGGTVVDIQGSQGQLFSVTDDLSGSIFAVSDISGVPIFDVNSSGVSYFDGKVGIGTAAPTSKLHVQGSATSGNYAAYIHNASGGGNVLKLYNHDWDTGDFLIYATNGGTAASGYGFTVDGNARVNIGLSTVAAANAAADDLHLKSLGSNGITISSGNSQTGTIFFGDVANSAAAGFRYNHNTGDMAISAEDNITFACDNVGIGTTSPSVPLAVEGVASMGSNSRLSMGILDINSGATPTQILIQTTIPWNSASADFTVNIKGFVYGTDESCNLSIHWHYYNNVPYNANITSSGSWAPIAKLHSSDATTPANGFVQIHLLSPGYWPKIYVESMYSSAYNDLYASGWSWSDAAGTGTAYALDYNKDFGNNFVMTDPGNVGIGTSSPGKKLEVAGSYKLGTNAYIEYGGVYPYTISTLNTASVGNLIFTAGAGSSGYESGITLQGSNTASDDGITFTAGSSTAMVIQVDGNVGIGLTAPTTKLYVHNGEATIASATDGVKLSYSNGNSSGIIDTAFSDNNLEFRTNGTAKMWIANGGNVGIGTANPGYKLHVDDDTAYGGVLIEGDNAPGLSIRDNSGTSLSKIYVQSTASSQGNLRISSDDNNTATTPTIEFIIGGSHKMRVLDNGNVGIGTTSPSVRLSIEKTNVVNTAVDVLKLGDDTNGLVFKSFFDANGIAWRLNKGLSGINMMTFTQPGNVGIGTTDPQKNLTIASAQGDGIQFNYDTTSNYRHQILNYWNSNADSRMDFNIARTSGQAPETIMSVGYGGNVGIGTTSPSSKLDVNSGISSSSIDVIKLSQATTGTVKAAASLGISIQNGGESTNAADLWFTTATGGSLSERMRISSAGAIKFNAYGAGFLQTDANGNITAGSVTTSDTLDDVTDNGNSTTNSIVLGASTVNGTMLVGGSYASGNIVVIGGMKSSGGAMIGYAVKPDTANNHGFVSSSAFTLERSAYYQQGNRHRWYAGASQDVAIGNAVSISETMRLDFDKLGLSTTNPATLLHLGKATNGTNIISLGEASIGGPHGLDFYGDDATRTKKFSIYYRTGTENISMETSNGTKRFEINQNGGVTFNEAFTFPTADGSAGAALVTNGSGALSWGGGYQQYSPVGWTILNNQTYTSTGANISSSSTQAQAGTTPVQRNSATEFEATKQGWYEISYSFIVKNNYTNRAMIGAYMTASTSTGGGVISGSHSTDYVRYNTYGEYAQIQNTFYYYTAAASTDFYLLAYLLSGSMNMTTQSINQSMISFRYINNDIT